MAEMVERTRVGKPRDLAMEFAYADQKKCKFLTAVKKGEAPKQVLQEWPADDYLTPNTTGKVDSATIGSSDKENAFSGAGLLRTYIHILERVPGVSLLSEYIEVAGIPKKQAYAKSIAKMLVQIKRDMSTVVLGDGEHQEDNGTVGYETRGHGLWLSTSEQAELPVPEAFRPSADQNYTGAIDEIDDATFEDLMEASWNQTGEEEADFTVWSGSLIKKQMARTTVYGKSESTDYTTVREFSQDGGSKRVTRAVDVIDTEFGTAKLILESNINTGGDPTTAASKRIAYGMPDDQAQVNFLVNPFAKEMPYDGGGRYGQVLTIFSNTYQRPDTGFMIKAAAPST